MKIVIDIPEPYYKELITTDDFYLDSSGKAIKNGKPLPKGEWKRMSELPEEQDDRYKCSRCGNVIHCKQKVDLYTFHLWCGRCGSLNDKSRWRLVEEREVKADEDSN